MSLNLHIQFNVHNIDKSVDSMIFVKNLYKVTVLGLSHQAEVYMSDLHPNVVLQAYNPEDTDEYHYNQIMNTITTK